MTFTQIKETCLYCSDLEAVKTFYNEQLELPIISYVKEKHIFFRAGSSVLLCFNADDTKLKKSPPAHYAIGKQHIAFEVSVDTYEKSKAEIVAKGIVVTHQVVWESGQESFYFEDPSGNVLEIVPKGIWE
jgi:catechol 2,3-dioxygenase-like lactoylglutathione lyase family enzyme